MSNFIYELKSVFNDSLKSKWSSRLDYIEVDNSYYFLLLGVSEFLSLDSIEEIYVFLRKSNKENSSYVFTYNTYNQTYDGKFLSLHQLLNFLVYIKRKEEFDWVYKLFYLKESVEKKIELKPKRKLQFDKLKNKIRYYKFNNKKYFVAKDVFFVLNITSFNYCLDKYCKNIIKKDIRTGKIIQKVVFIEEEDVLFVINNYDLEEDKNLVFEKILTYSEEIKENDLIKSDKKETKANDIQIFNFDNFEVRTVIKDGNIWFVGIDICKILDYKNPSDVMNKFCKDISKHEVLSNGGYQETNIIPESDLYRLVLRSKMPNAERFTDWVTKEVLPSIRKTGSYSLLQEDPRLKLTSEFMQKITDTIKNYEMQVIKLNTINDEYKQEALKLVDETNKKKGCISIGDFAKLRLSNTPKIGPITVFNVLRSMKYLLPHKDKKVPYEDVDFFFEVFDIKSPNSSNDNPTYNVITKIKNSQIEKLHHKIIEYLHTKEGHLLYGKYLNERWIEETKKYLPHDFDPEKPFNRTKIYSVKNIEK